MAGRRSCSSSLPDEPPDDVPAARAAPAGSWCRAAPARRRRHHPRRRGRAKATCSSGTSRLGCRWLWRARLIDDFQRRYACPNGPSPEPSPHNSATNYYSPTGGSRERRIAPSPSPLRLHECLAQPASLFSEREKGRRAQFRSRRPLSCVAIHRTTSSPLACRVDIDHACSPELAADARYRVDPGRR